jgi:aryl-alcohol dehydrogenase-like predicted oxidoreductase
MEAIMIQHIAFGRTGHASTRTLFGAAALSDVSQDDADRTLEVILEHGVNHIDVAASYGDAELRIGPWMDRHRGDFFLATKTGERSYTAAREEIHRSLDRLRTDHLDLIQLHNLVDAGEWDEALSDGGALQACVEARDQGLVRFIGVTGHGTPIPAMHLKSLERFDFDSVLFPYSWIMMQDEHYAANVQRLLSLCAERSVAVQTIKSIAARPWNGRTKTHAPWYEPLDEQASLDAAVGWVLANEQVFLNTVSDIAILPKQLSAAERFFQTPEVQETYARRLESLSLEPLFV